MATRTFLGTVDSDWNNVGNWDTTIPSAHDNAVISANVTSANQISPLCLFHFDNNYTDSSPSSLSTTANGNTTLSSTQSKFGGYSVYFDGSSNTFLSIGDSTSISGDFTIEFWLYFSVYDTGEGATHIIGRHSSGTGADWLLGIHNTNVLYLEIGGSSITANTTVTYDVWHHVAVTRKNGLVKIFLDGKEDASATISSTLGTTYSLTLGGDSTGTNLMTGYVDELRIVNGLCVYDSSFDPPESEFANYTVRSVDARTSLLLHFDGANNDTSTTDNSPNNHAVTFNGDSKISTTQSKFGGSSVYFDGDGDYLSVPYSSDWDFGTGDFTIELWANIPSVSSQTVSISAGGYSNGWALYIGNSPGISFACNDGDGWSGLDSYDNPSINTWFHVAVVRNSGTTTIYLDGIDIGSTGNFSGNITANSSELRIGIDGSFGAFSGFIDELRIVKGAALYTRNFTPPSSAHTNLNTTNYNNAVANEITFGAYTLDVALVGNNILFDGSTVGSTNALSVSSYDIKLQNSSSVNSTTTLTSPNPVVFAGATNAGSITNDARLEYPQNRSSAWNTGSIGGSTTYGTYPTFYFYSTSSFDWNVLSTWYIDTSYSTASAYVPGSLDDVVLRIPSSSSSDLTVNNATIETSNFSTDGGVYGLRTLFANNVTVPSGYSVGNSMGQPASIDCDDMTFEGNSSLNNSNSNITVSNKCVFQDTSSMNNGNINGITRFEDTSSFTGGVVDDIEVVYPNTTPFVVGGTLGGSLYYKDYPSRTVYFYDPTNLNLDFSNLSNWWDNSSHTVQAGYLPGGGPSNQSSYQNNVVDSIIIDSTLNTNSNNIYTNLEDITIENGTVNLSMTADNDMIFNNSSSNGGTLTAMNDTIFNDLSSNNGTITANNVYFYDNSSNNGTINTTGMGNIYISYPVSVPVGGTLNPGGSVLYLGYTYYFNDTISGDGDWNNANNWFVDVSNTGSTGSTPSEIFPGDNVVLQTSVDTSSGGTPTANNLSAGGSVALSIAVTVNNLATFSGSSQLYNDGSISFGEINGDALFTESSTVTGRSSGANGGIIQGLATFTLSSAEEMILGAGGPTGGQFNGGIEFQYGKGVNGSSILGIV